MRCVPVIRHAAFALAYLTLTNCAIVDQYSDRATTYNLEAEQAQEKGILLNIIRSSLRRPLQFTSVASIVGSASATGSGGYSGPVNIPFRSSGGTGSYPNLTTWTAGGSLTGSDTFTVPVLDTQEFYQGVLKPIPSQYLDLLVQQRYPMDLLFNWFIQKVVVRIEDEHCKGDHTDRCETIFRNYVSRDDDIQQFQMFAHYLIRAGLTTEPENRKDSLLKGAMNINLKLIGGSAQSAASGGSSGGASSGGAQGAEPLPKNYVFCFAPRWRKYSLWSPETVPSGCGSKSEVTVAAGDETPANIMTISKLGPGWPRGPRPSSTEVTIYGAPECKDVRYNFTDSLYREFCETMANFATGQKISFAFYTKSTEAVIYYLGEVMRRQLYPDQLDPPKRTIPIRVMFLTNAATTAAGTPREDLRLCVQPPEIAPSGDCQYIFAIENNSIAGPSSISVGYNGTNYSIQDYLRGGGYSMSSVEIVKQLLALFSSAKTLPSTTVLSVVNQ